MAVGAAGLVLARALIAVLAAVVGGVLAAFVGRIGHRLLCGMISFAAGALLAVSILDILPEAAELGGLVPVLVAAPLGFALFYAIGRWLYVICPACNATALDAERGYLRLGLLLLISISLHAFMDGLAIAAGHEAMPGLGIVILFAVSYHKVPEGLSLTSLAMASGAKPARAVVLTALVELITGAGALVGLALHGVPPRLLGLVLGVVAGSFLYVVVFALLREMWEHERRTIVLDAALGFLSIVIVGWVVRSIVG